MSLISQLAKVASNLGNLDEKQYFTNSYKDLMEVIGHKAIISHGVKLDTN